MFTELTGSPTLCGSSVTMMHAADLRDCDDLALRRRFDLSWKWRVPLVFKQAGAPQRLTGYCLICSIPFSVLKQIEVAPGFSAEKQRAISELPYMPMARVFLQSRRRFWLEQGFKDFGSSDSVQR